MEQGLRLRALYRSLGWKRSECAQFFHVSARTLHNWESGATAIPYAVLKLLRIHARYELPGQEWNGWVFHSGKLWTPEGGRWFGCLTANELGQAFGRDSVVHAALAAGGLTKRVVEEAAKLNGLRKVNGGQSAGKD